MTPKPTRIITRRNLKAISLLYIICLYGIIISSCINQSGKNQIALKTQQLIDKEVVALEILAIKVTEKIPADLNTKSLKKYLEMYVAIKDKNDKEFIEENSPKLSNILWYDTGAAVAYMLDELGISMDQGIKEGKTFLEIAESELDLSDKQKYARLKEAKKEFGWNSIQEKVDDMIE